ncbi:MAG: helix-turn-helix transcriptional regulator [Acidimicrobiia bacterium]|nr:helix-turn-helix transcriptional regulator [Acidimicrobiia bacterium]MYC57779.1 helix-turn-helix transcriptional regulator [Acidimicrobiia bacterium]MYI29812.1 helix-turn-helix transcriptional regulator [Acidimicrobiia bacterium]
MRYDCSVKTTDQGLEGGTGMRRHPSRAITSGPRLGQAIRQARNELGWTQAELSVRSGVARPQISAIESARADPKASTLIALLRSLDCEMEMHPVDHTRFRLDDHLKAIMDDG